jgi:hypothetical protein
MKKYILIATSLFCFQHLIHDRLQDDGIRNWYTTFGHSWFGFIPDTARNNHIGMAVFFLAGCCLLFFGLRSWRAA